jgi:hypothetical protein
MIEREILFDSLYQLLMIITEQNRQTAEHTFYFIIVHSILSCKVIDMSHGHDYINMQCDN